MSKCIELDDGTKEWHNDKGQLHREDGPAFVFLDYKAWYLNGKRHRIDGPAITGSTYEDWYYHGKFISCSSKEEFLRLIKLEVFW